MIGTRVTSRSRMSAHDAHYAGELVDGARMLALFGDVATELLIRLDGDEGLFRAYETVEFLAPVFAGDFIEATAELVGVGKTQPQDPVRGAQGDREPPAGRPRRERGRRPRAGRRRGAGDRARASSRRSCSAGRATLYMPGLPAGPAPEQRPDRDAGRTRATSS